MVRELRFDSLFFQVPCYLARYHRIDHEGRSVIEHLRSGRLLESWEADRTFCCGGGGGQMWLDVRAGERVENVRLRQIESFAPEIIATACPFCKIMLDSAKSSRGPADGQRIAGIRDISELVLHSL